MNIKTLKIGAVLSHKNDYGNDRLEIEIEIDEADDYKLVYEEGRAEVYRLLGRSDLDETNRKLRREYDDLCRKVYEANKQWEQTRAFLIGQGIKDDVPPFPEIPLLAEAISNSSAITPEYDLDF